MNETKSWKTLCEGCFGKEFPDGAEEVTIGCVFVEACEGCGVPLNFSKDVIRTPMRAKKEGLNPL